jgi:hypothetical protein
MMGMDPFQGLNACLFIRAHHMHTLGMQCFSLVVEFAHSSHYRVAGGSYLPPAPTERGVRISRTTLFRRCFTAQQIASVARRAD